MRLARTPRRLGLDFSQARLPLLLVPLLATPALAQYDFGDAPDSPYPTTSSNNGAQHDTTGGVYYLGASVDSESDGQPEAHALGDDNNGDDEDGVVFTSALVPGQMATVSVTASASGGYLNAWLDFGADGSWGDTWDQIFTNQLLSSGTNTLSFSVPPDAKPGPTFARFRFDSGGYLSYTGAATDGEVEDYEVIIDGDYGDAPAPYPEARHGVGDGTHYLGGSPDYESVNQPDPNALGDDNNGTDDEDGVTFVDALVPGQQAQVSVLGPPSGTILSAWVDFNRDGDWSDSGEQVFFDRLLSAGSNVLSIDVPASAVPGMTFARFRVSSASGLLYDGAAPDGEVEDYEVEIVAYDFGDAPDPLVATAGQYPTLLANDGARHKVTSVHLGAAIDADDDGQPTPTADGDDNDGTDDEDGITAGPTVLMPDATAIWTINASAAGYLNWWVDFDQNGVFDAGERVLADEPLTAGNNDTVNWVVPSAAVQGMTFMRLRFTSQSGEVTQPTGPASDGEVEDYQIAVAGPVVKTTGDGPDDPWTLRSALFYANAHPGTTITFEIPNADPGWNDTDKVALIQPTTVLPPIIASNTTLDGESQKSFSGSTKDWPAVQLLGTPGLTNGLTIEASAQSSTVKGFTIGGFDQHGIAVAANGVTIATCQIGTVHDGAGPCPNGGDGINVVANNVQIGGLSPLDFTVISGNAGNGVTIDGGASGGKVENCSIGLSRAGANAVANGGHGVELRGGANGNTIGGPDTASACTISGNALDGIHVTGSGTNNNLVRFCCLGGNSNCDAAIPNGDDGVEIANGAQSNKIGDGPNSQGNLIFGNTSHGVNLNGPGTSYNTVQHNSIGTGVNGNETGLGNGRDGVRVENCSDNGIGGTGNNDGNVISGNNGSGVHLATATNTKVEGNAIGTDRNATTALPNGEFGVALADSANNTIGGTDPNATNVISGNGTAGSGGVGVHLGGSATTGNLIRKNVIGSDLYMTVDLGNKLEGVRIEQGASGNTIQENAILYNVEEGVAITDATSLRNALLGNLMHDNAALLPDTLGIDLGKDGRTLNDFRDADGSPNKLQNYPDFIATIDGAGDVRIDYRVDSDPANATYPLHVEFFKAHTDGQGRSLVGTDSFTTTDFMNGGKSLNLGSASSLGASLGDLLVGTATDAETPGNTSEFSPPVPLSELDFGDAPDTPYPTLLANNGARHPIVGGVFLGSAVDAEHDGQPSTDATGDNDDGVVLKTMLIPGQQADVDVTASKAGILTAWIDFNNDGDWEDTDERVLTDVTLSAGLNQLNFVVPAGAQQGPAYARFRFDTGGALHWDGPARDGEVEDYLYGVSGPVVTNINDAGVGSLRDAIDFANANSGSDTITFAIPGGGVHTIVPLSALPTITDPVVIDGWSQGGAGYSGPPLIEIVGSNAGAGVDGLEIVAGSSIVKGLIVNRFSANGISLATGGGNTVFGCYLGTDSAGMLARGNAYHGVAVLGSSDNQIGGSTASEGNLISGNDQHGVYIGGTGSARNLVQGNRIGTTADGNGAVPNSNGISIDSGAYDNTIGGTGIGESNRVAHNGYGVLMGSDAGTGNTIRGNEIFDSTSGLGIDLKFDGVTPNDSGDTDTGPNNLQNFPVLLAVHPGASTSTIVTGKIDTPSPDAVHLDFYQNDAADPSGYGEGQTYLGAGMPDSEGTFSVTLPTTVPNDKWITATATDANGNTSEFSKALQMGTEADADYGDAPDSYKTLYASDGARHFKSPLFLGTGIDVEADGHPDANALGDDNDNTDDEDGVQFLTPVAPGAEAKIQVTASGDGSLQAWLDYNRDGDWDDTGEEILTSEFVSAGTKTFTIWVPADAAFGLSYARFRLSSQGVASYTGFAQDGEVEDYTVTIGGARDYGDSPDSPYPTLEQNDGARHTIWPGFHLGAMVDAEADGQPEATAAGDDTDAQGDDEDGVRFVDALTPDGQANVDVTVATPAGLTPVLDAWIDFNGDGAWQSDEWIFNGLTLPNPNGTNTLSFGVPIEAKPGTTFARFRLSHDGVTAPTGYAPHGEVEDYQVDIWKVESSLAPPTDANAVGTDHTVTCTVTVNGQPEQDIGVDFSVTSGPNQGTTGTGKTDSNGQATFTYTGSGGIGTDTIEASGSTHGVAFSCTAEKEWKTLDLEVTKTASNPQPKEGDTIVYTLEVANLSGVGASGVQVTDNLPTGVTYQSHNQGPDYNAGTGVWNVGDLPAQGKATVEITATVDPDASTLAQPILNTATLTHVDQTDSNTQNDTGEAAIEAAPAHDFGDAPAPYPTVRADDGARHKVGGPWLGDSQDMPDTEPDGNPSPSAQGDDTAADDDENAVNIPRLVIGRHTDLNVAVSGGGGVLEAWIDWNGDGTWQHPAEQIFAGTVGDGIHAVPVTPPANAATTPTFARFRISTQGGLLPTGPAADGEVEDHEVLFGAELRGTKWNDLNGDGIRDSNEPGLANWTIEALDANGAVAATTLTDANGEYVLPVAPGSYTVREVLQSDWVQTYPDGEGTHSASVQAGNVEAGLDFGNYQPAIEVDQTDGASAEVALADSNGEVHEVLLTGTLEVHVTFEGSEDGMAFDGDADGLDEVTTEIVALDLRGESPTLGPVRMSLDLVHPSLGILEERVNETPGLLDVQPFHTGADPFDFPADSFFDVWSELEIPSQQPGKLRPADPGRLAGAITHKPPAEGEGLVDDQHHPLFDDAGQPSPYTLLSLRLTPNPLPASDVECTLSPPSDTNLLNSEHTVTCQLLVKGRPHPGVPVTFGVPRGPNAGETDRLSTDANGEAQFTYVGDGGVGEDVIRVRGVVDGTLFTATAAKVWEVGEPHDVLLSADRTQVKIGESVSLTATVLDAQGNPVPGVEVRIAREHGEGTLVISTDPPVTDAKGEVHATLQNVSFGTNTVKAEVVLSRAEADPIEATLDILGAFELKLRQGLQLFALPFSDLPAPPTVLDIPAEYLKLARYNPAEEAYRLYSQAPFLFELGQGYFGKFDTPRVVSITQGTPATRAYDAPDLVFPHRGWQLLGNPFLDQLMWDLNAIELVKATADNVRTTLGPLSAYVRGSQSLERVAEPYLWGYDPDADPEDPYYLIFDPAYMGDVPTPLREHVRDHLKAGQGAFAMTNANNAGYRFTGSLGTPTGGTALPNPTRSSKATETNWSLELVAQCGDAKDATNVLGVMGGRANGFQLAEPPVIERSDGTHFSLAFAPPAGKGRLRSGTGAPAMLAVDVRPEIGLKAEWEAVVRTNRTDAPVTLSWPDLSALPKHYRAYLVDTETGRKQAMRTTTSYRFRTRAEGATEHRFVIEVDASGTSRLQITGVAVVPNGRGTGMSVAFTLSQPANVQLVLKNAAGRSVYTVGSHQSTAGANAVSLTGRSAAGQPLARGLYTLELIAEADTGERFRVLRPVGLR